MKTFAMPISLLTEYRLNHDRSARTSLWGTSTINLLKILRTHGADSAIPTIIIVATPRRLAFLCFEKINLNEKNRTTKRAAVRNETV